METQEQKQATVAILTPYLYENMEKSGCTPEYIRKQKEKYGYDPNNFSGISTMQTEAGRVIGLETRPSHKMPSPACSDFAIAGSTENGEAEVSSLRNTGLIIARFSIFYGKPSNYSGNMPEQTGYALDMPKSVAAAEAVLKNDQFIDAILSRDEARILAAIEGINKTLQQPVLVTPFLKQALSVKTCRNNSGICQVVNKGMEQLIGMLEQARAQRTN